MTKYSILVIGTCTDTFCTDSESPRVICFINNDLIWHYQIDLFIPEVCCRYCELRIIASKWLRPIGIAFRVIKVVKSICKGSIKVKIQFILPFAVRLLASISINSANTNSKFWIWIWSYLSPNYLVQTKLAQTEIWQN